MSPTLTIMRGISGSGKSTWANSQANVVVVSRDAIRIQLYGSDGPEYYGVAKDILSLRERRVTLVHDGIIHHSLTAGDDVIVDNTHIELKYVEQLEAIASNLGARVRIVVIDVPLEKAIANNSRRAAHGGRYVPEDVIRNQYERLQLTKDYLPSEGLL